MLALSLFALVVGIGHACGLDASHSGVVGSVLHNGDRADTPSDLLMSDSDDVCVDDVPLIAKLASVQASPAGPSVPAFIRWETKLAAVVATARRLGCNSELTADPILHTRFLRLSL